MSIYYLHKPLAYLMCAVILVKAKMIACRLSLFYHLSMLRSFSNVSLSDAAVHRKISLTFPTVQAPSGALITRLTFIFPLN